MSQNQRSFHPEHPNLTNFMFLVIVYSDTPTEGTYTIDCETLDEASDCYWEERAKMETWGGPEWHINVIEVAQFIDFI
jgi:hypothetical protein